MNTKATRRMNLPRCKVCGGPIDAALPTPFCGPACAESDYPRPYSVELARHRALIEQASRCQGGNDCHNPEPHPATVCITWRTPTMGGPAYWYQCAESAEAIVGDFTRRRIEFEARPFPTPLDNKATQAATLAAQQDRINWESERLHTPSGRTLFPPRD